MEDSILNTVKKMIGPSAQYEEFDTDLIVYINSIFFTLYQLNVGPTSPFSIKDDSASWTDFVNDETLNAVKAYVVLKARLYFDPPSNSSIMSAMKAQCDEFEWRMNVEADPGK